MKKIKGFQLENNSVTKNKIKLIGNNSLVSSDIKLNTSSNKTIENRFIEINNDLNGLNNNVNNLSQQVAQVISSYGANVIELPVTETLSAFTPTGFDSNGNIKKLTNYSSTSNFVGILLEAANQGEIKKIATPGSIITIPNANFIPGNYYTFNTSTNVYEQITNKNIAVFKALTNNKVYILDNLV